MSNFPWVKGKEYDEIIYETYDGIAKITINRPECRNAFTPKTNIEMYDAFSIARDDASIGVIILTGANHDGRPEDQAFCSGGCFELPLRSFHCGRNCKIRSDGTSRG